MRAAVAVLGLFLSGCLAPAAPLAPDPAASLLALGPLGTVRQGYDLGLIPLTDPSNGYTYLARMLGEVTYPEAGEGPFPVVLFLHGRHGTCVFPDGEQLSPFFPCPDAPPVATPIDSYQGYRYLADHLASRGIVVVSASANEVNDHDEVFPKLCWVGACAAFLACDYAPQACNDVDSMAAPLYGALATDHGTDERAELIVQTLDRFAAFHRTGQGAPFAADLQGRLDLERIGLMGHSRGGEGVTRAITYNQQRTDGPVHAIRAVLALAPSDFAGWTAPDVAWATLLPSCDGDVWTQHGAWMYDDSRFLDEAVPSPKFQWVIQGANHNWYNTVWWQDDATYADHVRDDPQCGAEDGEHGFGTHRFTPERQQANGVAYMGGFFRWALGGEAGLLPLLRGEVNPPYDACREWSCQFMVRASYQPPGPDRLVIEDTLDASAMSSNDLGGASTFEGFTSAFPCAPNWEGTCPNAPNWARAPQVALAWDAERGGIAWYRTAIPAEHGDVRGFRELGLRVAPDWDPRVSDGRADFAVQLTDAAGRAHAVYASAHDPLGMLYAPEGESARFSLPVSVRIPLAAFAAAGVDLGNVREVALRFGDQPRGALTLTDLQFQR